MQRAHVACLGVLSFGLLLSLESCSSGSHPSAPPNPAATKSASSNPSPSSTEPAGPMPAQFYTPPGAVYQVTYTPNTVRLDLATVQKTLRSMSPDARVFLFDASDAQVRALAPGKVMFLEHLGVRKVTSVSNQGSQIAVVTDEAAWGDFIQDGRIEFKMPVNFRGMTARGTPPRASEVLFAGLRGWLDSPERVFADDQSSPGGIGVHVKGQINSWNYEVSGAPQGDGFKLNLEADKKIAGMNVRITSDGDLDHVVTAFQAQIQGGKMQNFEYNTPLEGKVHVTWAALTDGPNGGIGEARLALPPFGKQVIDVYGLPLLFRIDEALIFKPGFGTKKDAASGGFDLAYNGTEGLTIHSGQSKAEGTMDAKPALEPTTASSLAAQGIVLAINAPKISVSLGTESLKEAIQQVVPAALLNKAAQLLEAAGLGGAVKQANNFFTIEGAAYVQLVTEFDYAGSGPLSLVPCTMTHLNFLGQAGPTPPSLDLAESRRS